MLETHDRRRLVALAQRSIECGIGQAGPAPAPRQVLPPALLEPRATFATLTLAGELRGCCGSLDAVRPLALDVWHNAWASAFADPRFPAVAAAEIETLEITISVLTPLEPLPFTGERELIDGLEPRVDGLVLEIGARRATFLPAVWDMLPEPCDFLRELKHKAGWTRSELPRGARAWRYRTESFSGAATVLRRDALEHALPGSPAPA